jgi:hypothetical protein
MAGLSDTGHWTLGDSHDQADADSDPPSDKWNAAELVLPGHATSHSLRRGKSDSDQDGAILLFRTSDSFVTRNNGRNPPIQCS